jgi:hypothetical protein
MKQLAQRLRTGLAAGLAYIVVVGSPVSASETISIGETVAGEINDPAVAAEYSFTAAAGQRIFIDLISSSNINRLVWCLSDAFDRIILQDPTALGDLGPVFLMGGEYRLKIKSENTEIGTFEFKVVDSPVSSSSLTVGDSVQGAITKPGGRIDYEFTASAGDTIFIDIVRPPASAGALNFLLTSPGGREVLPRTPSLRDYGPFSLQGGVYTLSVIGERDGVGEFEFNVLPVSVAESAISLGETICDAITTAGSSNRYSFTASPSQIVQFDVLSSTNFSGLNFILEDAWGRAVLPRTTHIFDPPPVSLAGGDYVLSVLGEAGSIGQYCFELLDSGTSSFVPVGTLIAVGETIEDAIDVEGETDSYKFAVLDGERVFLDLTLGQVALRWTLLDPVGRPLFEVAGAQSPGNDQGPFRLAAGDYTLQVFATSSTPAYSFTLWPASEQVSAVTLGDSLEDSFAAPGDRHHYDISLLSDPDRVYLQTLVGSTQLRGSMVDEVGQSVFKNASMVSSRGPMNLDQGGYRLTLNTTSGTQASYAVDLVDVINEDGGAVEIGGQVEDALPGVRGTRTYSVTIDGVSQVVVFKMMASSLVRWSVIDPVGHPVFSARSGVFPPYAVRLAAGAYKIEVFSWTDDTPDYSFSLLPDAVFDDGFETFNQ